MDNSSGKINYWPGFVDAFSNLVLALVFVIVILAMSLGMFSGLMAKMAIQRALVEQRLKESQATPAAVGNAATGTLDPAEADDQNDAVDQDDADPTQALATTQDSAMAPPAQADDARTPAPDLAAQAELRKENDALRQELAALRRKQATPSPSPAAEAGSKIDSATVPPDAPRPQDPFGPMMPGGDPKLQRHIDADLKRVLKEFDALHDSAAMIHVAIHVPNYALTENKRTALFYLISIKDYLMKKNVSPERIQMHMDPAPAGQNDMTVSMSVER
ncbi:hypothetical protein [Achromobacter sp.]|uniref:hypothetical protein n=1 Tax=Achromobacter sp. TaxID=134375 RepID=UPI003CFCB869